MADRKKLNLNRVEMPKQADFIRKRNFKEVALGYTVENAIEEASRCLDCKKPLCIEGCPVEIDIPGFIRFMAEGDFANAIKTLKEKNCLPAVCGRVCPQEEQCESRCILVKKGAPIAIGRLERFAADWEAEQGRVQAPEIMKKTGKKVAVIGSGPAGVTVAGDLTLLGHNVTMYEALHEPGGVLTYGIPEFRLPAGVVTREIDNLQKLGVKLVCNFVVGKTRSLQQILEEFDAVFVGTGAGLPWFMNIPGENLNGVYSANEYLTRVNLMRGFEYPKTYTPVVRHRKVAVVGGGNVAMDCARTALRLGAEKSVIVYRRSEKELPAREEEYVNAREEGVIFHFLTLPEKLYGNDEGWLNEIECARMKLGEPDASGRRRPVRIDNSEFIMKMDACIIAIGNSPNPIIPQTTPDLEVSKWGTIEVDPDTLKTSIDRVWAGGDIVTGAATVILAMGAGRKAARSMHEYLVSD
ncbi:MAG TPA: NADPH-dependent glutamate synthase [Bacteroidetes bacterium]|nr:NADPH-dependent glutamate synthase [Bacteroidota bacterium]